MTELIRFHRPWPPIHIELPRHPRIWRANREVGRKAYEKAKHGAN
jgi:hypothetical protein